MRSTTLEEALDLIAEVPDFPQPGVLFQDLTPLFGDARGFATVVDALNDTVGEEVDRLVAVEARGFVLAAAMGYACGLGVTLVRKPGKLPSVAGHAEYEMEYGTTTLELPAGALREGEHVVIVDDVLATGGTVAATTALMRECGAQVSGIAVVLELAALRGREQLPDLPVHVLRTL